MRNLALFLLAILFVVECGPEEKQMLSSILSIDSGTEKELVPEIPRVRLPDISVSDKIIGPWIWMIASTEPGQGGPDSIDIDSLVVASDGAVTEAGVAAKGAAVGDVVGDLAWMFGLIAATGYNNINDLVNQIGLGKDDVDDYSSYALIILESATARSDMTMQVGSDDSIKVWLNGEVIHRNPAYRPANNFQESFKETA